MDTRGAGSIPASQTNLYPARLLARSTPFQGVGTGSIPVQDAKFNAVVVLWEGTGLSIQLRRVRFPSTAPILFREIQARCRDLTVNQWLGEFDSHTRSQVLVAAVVQANKFKCTRYRYQILSVANNGGSSGLRRILARFLTTRVRFPGLPPS